MSNLRIITFVILTLFLIPLLMFAWGCEGHQTIALIALKQLGSNALSRVNELLQGYPLGNVNHPCSASQLGVFADVSTWADDIRTVRRETAPWHFIDIPLATSRSDLGSFCPSDR